jgi:hypothetical protein
LFASSLAVKYYLRSISKGNNSGYLRFPKIYDISSSNPTLNKYEVNFSHGISLPIDEVFTNVPNLGFAIVHNRNIRNAHHDIILPTRTNQGFVNIAVQAKLSYDLSDRATLDKQLLVSPKSLEKVKLLFWLYLGDNRREEKFEFLNGSNGLALDFFILVKKLSPKIKNKFTMIEGIRF